MVSLRASILACLGLAACGGGGGPFGNDGEVREVSLDSVSDCLNLGGTGTDECLDAMFASYLTEHTTREALALLQSYENESEMIRVACHPVAHSIGRETFKKTQTIHDSFNECDQTCHSGCYHGVMERFLGGTSGGHVTTRELLDKIPGACDPTLSLTVRFQCLHGLGHAVLYFTSYDLPGSLDLCTATGDPWSQESCYGGVFMENIVASDPSLRDLSSTDFHYPCSTVDAKFRSSCYLMQTSRMTEMGLAPPQIMEECRNAGIHTYTCQQSLGRDLSNTARAGHPRSVSETCELGADDKERQACTRGVVWALVDNTWDGRYALPYCPTYATAADVEYCYSATTSYLRTTYGRSLDQVEAECRAWVPDDAACLAAIFR